MVADPGYEDFLEPRQGEVRRINLPRTPLNKGMAPLQSGRNRLREDE